MWNLKKILYSSGELSEREIMAEILFTIATAKMKCVGVNLIREVKASAMKMIKHWFKKPSRSDTQKGSLLMDRKDKYH